MSRAIHGVIDRVYRNGELVAERHRYDNRLTMAVLSRLDKQAEGLDENAPVARAVSHEFDRFLDLLPQGVEGAERFLAARFPPPLEDGRPSLPPDTELHRLARLAAYETLGVALPEEVDVADLDPAQMESWTEDQLTRAEFSGFLKEVSEAEWPLAVRSPPTAPLGEGDQPEAGGGAGAERPDGPSEPAPDETHGMCKLRIRYHPPAAAPAPEPDDFANCEIWEESDGEWVTNFPPPPGFDGHEEGEPGGDDYRRALTETEAAIIGVTEEQVAAERAAILAERLAREEAAHDRFFSYMAAGEAG